MKDRLHDLLKWIDHNRCKVFGVLLACIIVGCFIGCQIKTTSVVDPGKEVTQDQFHQEYNVAVAEIDRKYLLLEEEAKQLTVNYEIGAEDLDQKIEQRKKWLELGSGVVTSLLSGNPIGVSDVLPSAGFLLLAGLTTGSVFDQRRKDKVIKNLKNGGAAKTT